MKKFLLVLSFLFLISPLYAEDSELLKVHINDFQGGQNSFDLADVINPNQGESFKNIVLSKRGQLFKRTGQAMFANDPAETAWTGIGAFASGPNVATYYILAASGAEVVYSTTTGDDWTAINPESDDLLTTGQDTEFIQANNTVFIINGKDRPAYWDGEIYERGFSSEASPPIASTGAWLRNYLFLAGNPILYDFVSYSSNLDPTTWDITDALKVNTGDGQSVVKLEAFRLNELIAYKERSIYVIDISGAVDAWTIQPISRSVGCIAPRSVVSLGNDQWFLSSTPIAVRSLVRSAYDKILVDIVSYPIQNYLDGTGDTTINETYIGNACAVLFDDNYILAITTGTSTVNNTVLVYDFKTKSWYVIDGWYPKGWQVYNNNLYYIDANDSRVVQCFTGTAGDFSEGPLYATSSASEPSVAITYEYISKNIDFENPNNYKILDALEVQFGTAGNYTATIYIELDDGGWQEVGTINLSGDAPVLPIDLPFDLVPAGVARHTFQLQRYGEFRKIQIKIIQDGLNEECNLYSATLFAKIRKWRRED